MNLVVEQAARCAGRVVIELLAEDGSRLGLFAAGAFACVAAGLLVYWDAGKAAQRRSLWCNIVNPACGARLRGIHRFYTGIRRFFDWFIAS